MSALAYIRLIDALAITHECRIMTGATRHHDGEPLGSWMCESRESHRWHIRVLPALAPPEEPQP